MVESKAWDWEKSNEKIWLTPSENSYYYAHKWHEEGRHSILDLGCGLGRHSIFFAKSGFKVTAFDMSEYGLKHLSEWQETENVYVHTVHGDMLSLPFPDCSFDCLWAYHVISHTNTDGFIEVLNEIKRVLKPDGEAFFSLCSKNSDSFVSGRYKLIDKNTILKDEPPEKDIPHCFFERSDILELLNGFDIHHIKYVDDCCVDNKPTKNCHYFIEMSVHKDDVKRDYSSVVGSIVSVTVDRPLGSTHPRAESLVYPVNYGYVEDVIAGDNEAQDVYLLGVDTPVKSYTARVIAVYHRHNDVEDKWIAAPDGVDFTDEEILKQIDFQEKFFDGELYR